MDLNPGTRVGPYEIAAQLGAGGWGVVCPAPDTELQRDVAWPTDARQKAGHRRQETGGGAAR